jgi:hypothetical protein
VSIEPIEVESIELAVEVENVCLRSCIDDLGICVCFDESSDDEPTNDSVDEPDSFDADQCLSDSDSSDDDEPTVVDDSDDDSSDDEPMPLSPVASPDSSNDGLMPSSVDEPVVIVVEPPKVLKCFIHQKPRDECPCNNVRPDESESDNDEVELAADESDNDEVEAHNPDDEFDPCF